MTPLAIHAEAGGTGSVADEHAVGLGVGGSRVDVRVTLVGTG